MMLTMKSGSPSTMHAFKQKAQHAREAQHTQVYGIIADLLLTVCSSDAGTKKLHSPNLHLNALPCTPEENREQSFHAAHTYIHFV